MSKSYEIQGQIHTIGQTTAYGKNGFTKREFVIQLTGEGQNPTYPNYVVLELIKDKCSIMDNFNIGDEIIATFNITGRLWSGNGQAERCFNSLQAWKVDKCGNTETMPPASDFDESRYMPDFVDDNSGEIPF